MGLLLLILVSIFGLKQVIAPISVRVADTMRDTARLAGHPQETLTRLAFRKEPQNHTSVGHLVDS
jgi:hypothetical protein